ncbi:MAG: DUF977 family protein [Thermoplasmata archaeon]|nr:DUF977 family protein [Thermoplasmata archaeon]
MNITDLLRTILEGENGHVEFKRSITKESAKDIVAFLNTLGGMILYGVDDDGSIIGIDGPIAPEKAVEGIEPNPFNKVEYEKMNIEDKTIIIARVSKSQRMYMYRKTVYMRMGTMNKPLSIEDILEKASESLLLRFDEMGNNKASIDDLERELVDDYFVKRSEYRNVDIPETDLEQKLQVIGAVTDRNLDRRPTNAGVLFFCKYPQRYLLQAVLRVSFFRSHDMMDSTDNRIFEGPLPEVVEQACAFIDHHIPLLSKLESGNISRTTRKAYPLMAVREALVNALTHRNYFDSADVRVFIFPDSMEITNPGGFPPGVTPDRPIHKPRNPLVSQYFFDLGYIEKYGMGLKRMKQACMEFGLSKPEFVLREAETKVIFFASGSDDIHSRILSRVDQEGQITSRDIVNMFGVSRDTANRYLHKILNAGQLRRVGKGRSVKYVK